MCSDKNYSHSFTICYEGELSDIWFWQLFQPRLTIFLGIFGVFGESGRITFDNTAGAAVGVRCCNWTFLSEWTFTEGGGGPGAATVDPYFSRTSLRSSCVSEYFSFASWAVSQPYWKYTNFSSNLWWIFEQTWMALIASKKVQVRSSSFLKTTISTNNSVKTQTFMEQLFIWLS